MWSCPQCREEVEESFEICWKCQATRSGKPTMPPPAPSMPCVRCGTEMKSLGTRSFHEGTRWGILGDLGELFVNREHLDCFACPRCGKMEFYAKGIGQELRPGGADADSGVV